MPTPQDATVEFQAPALDINLAGRPKPRPVPDPGRPSPPK